MHSAPSVSYPVGRSRFAGGLLLGLWLLGVAACVAWRLGSPASGARSAIAAIVLVLAAVLASWNWWRMPDGMLSWDQEQWSWQGGQAVVQVSLDLQHWMLLRCHAGSNSCWLWLERAKRPEHWAEVRRAVYSRARPEALPKAGPTAAKT
jgi:toxin CptA